MGKLTNLRPSVGLLPGNVARHTDAHGHSPQAEPLRRLYATARWKRLRLRTFTRDGFTCRRCGRLEGNTSRLVCDHRRPHRGDRALFWAEDNLQTLCKPCHDGAKQAEERSAP